jgi:hypothetical protein
MKTTLFSVALVSALFTFVVAAPPAKSDAKSKAKIQKVSARDLIEKFDTDSDKKLAKTELHSAFRSLKYNQFSSKSDSWKQFDTDKDEKLEAKELDALLDANVAAQVKSEEEAAKEAADPKSKEKPKSPFQLRPDGVK